MTKVLDKYVICPVCGVTLVKKVYSSWYDMPICGDCRSENAGLNKLERRALKDAYNGNLNPNYSIERDIKDLSIISNNKGVPKTKEYIADLEYELIHCNIVNHTVHRTYFCLHYGNNMYVNGYVALNLTVSVKNDPVYRYNYKLWSCVSTL